MSRYHLPTRGTPEVVQVTAADLHRLLSGARDALQRCLPQIRGVLPVADAEQAIRELTQALDELAGREP